MKLIRHQNVSANALARKQSAAFTMIEIALCLAVIAFALIAIIGTLPRGMAVQRDNREETIINQDAVYLMDAIRSGGRGLNDLTNYLEAITIKRGGVTTVYLSPYTPPTFTLSGNSGITLDDGQTIVGLLSMPQYYQGFTNNVTAYMRAISGNASEKTPQSSAAVRDMAFAYRLTAEVTPFITPGTTNFETQVFNNNMANSLYELRLTFRWPLLPSGFVGQGKLTFRTLASGSLLVTNLNGQNCYFIKPSTFVAAP